MDTPQLMAIAGAVGAVIGTPLGVLAKYLLDKRSQSAKQDLERQAAEAKADADARQQAHEQLIRLVGRLEARIDQLEKAHGDCQRENAELHEKVGKLTEAVARLEADIKDYEAGDA